MSVRRIDRALIAHLIADAEIMIGQARCRHGVDGGDKVRRRGREVYVMTAVFEAASITCRVPPVLVLFSWKETVAFAGSGTLVM